MSRIEQLGAWPARALWVVLALVAGGPLADALEGHSTPVRAVVVVALAVGWTGGLVALLVPRHASLTAVRLLVPGGLAAMVAAAVLGDTVDALDLVAVTVAALAVAAALAPWVTEAWVDGSSYGAERRLPLQTPVIVSTVLAPLTWLAVAVSAVTGPLLLATRQWALGLVAVAVGALVGRAGVRSLHQLARRWVVLVPTGLVLHDPLTMPEPQLFLRSSVARLGPAEAGSPADDLTAGASGLALELAFTEPVELLVRTKGRAAETRSSDAVLFTPARPRRLLDAARGHRIPVG